MYKHDLCLLLHDKTPVYIVTILCINMICLLLHDRTPVYIVKHSITGIIKNPNI